MSLSDIRRLTIDDLTGCLELAANRDWPREEHKWRLLFDVGEVYGIVEPGAGVVATTIVTRYGGGAAISMVLVAARHERKGLGGRLMRHALERSGDGAVMLYATEFGRPAVRAARLRGRGRGNRARRPVVGARGRRAVAAGDRGRPRRDRHARRGGHRP